MKILTVIPLAKGIPRDEVSYFSARDVSVGSLVTVPFGNRKIRAVVADAHSVRDLKSEIKGASFQLKNITEIHDEVLLRDLLADGQKTARFFAQPVGTIIETMVPQTIFDYYLAQSEIKELPRPVNTASSDLQLLQVPFLERISIFKTIIRENLARHTSTMIVAPTIAQVDKIAGLLTTGIEDRMIVLHSKKTKKSITKSLEQVLDSKQPVVAIVTPSFASLIRQDWEAVIVEQSSSRFYRYGFTGSFDMKFFIEQAMKSMRAERIIFADTFISLELRERHARREVYELRGTWHITRPELFDVLDMHQHQESLREKSFSLLHPKTVALIQKSIDEKSKIVLLASRKGLAPLTVCGDCGTVVTCPQCETPLVLHRKRNTSRTYLCHHCMYMTPPVDHCRTCMGSRLHLLGISTDRIVDEVKELFPKAAIFSVHDEEKSVAKNIKDWHKAETGILVGTHGTIPYLEQVPYGAIVSFDSLLSIPSYSSAETSLSVILSFLEKITAGAYLQTRTIHNDAVQAIVAENIFDFVRNELVSREQFGYPPAKILLKINTTAHTRDVQKATDFFEKVFQEYDPDILMKKTDKQDLMSVQATMKLDRALWSQNDALVHQILRDLPRNFSCEVNPDSVV